MLVIQQGKCICESPDPKSIALEKTEEEVNGQQMEVKEKCTLEKLGGEKDKKQIESSFCKQDHSLFHTEGTCIHTLSSKEAFSVAKYTRRHSSHAYCRPLKKTKLLANATLKC